MTAIARLTIHSPGLCTLLVDGGRPRTRSRGVPVGGAADRFALAIGNALVGNEADCAALELCLSGPTVQADIDLACVVFGAPFDLSYAGELIRPGQTFTLPAEEKLSIHGAPRGARAYLCVAGGFDAQLVLGSRSSLEALAAGTQLGCRPGSIRRSFLNAAFAWNAEPRCLRCLPGAQTSWFPDAQFEQQKYTITPSSNRMGLRLQSMPLAVPDRELTSEPVCPGSVQVTRNGQCIVLGVDGQTIGGYPKIAQVIAADVDKLGQLRPGDEVSFRPVTLDEAEAASIAKRAELRQWLLRLEAACGIAGELAPCQKS